MKKLSIIILACLLFSLLANVVVGTEIDTQEVVEPFSGEVTAIEEVAEEINNEDYIFSGEIVDETEFENELSEVITKDNNNNIMLFDKELNITGEAKDLILAAGGKIVSKALGSYAFLAANELDVSGEIFNDTFAVGNSIDVEGNIGRDLYALGNTIDINGYVARDVYAGSEVLNITGHIMGDVRFAGGSIFISPNAVIEGNLYLNTEEIEIREGATIKGVVEYPSSADEVIIPNDIQTSVKEVKVVEAPVQNKFAETLKSFLWWTIANCILFAIAIAIFPRLFENIKKVYGEDAVQKYCSSAGWGLLSIIVIPIISMLAIFTFIGSTLGIIGLILYTLGYMVATVIVGYALANTILENNKNKFVKGFLGILIIEVLRRLPVIGWIVALLVNSIAFGTVLKLMKQSNQKQEKIEVEKTEE